MYDLGDPSLSIRADVSRFYLVMWAQQPIGVSEFFAELKNVTERDILHLLAHYFLELYVFHYSSRFHN
jgi:hypothetical protein